MRAEARFTRDIYRRTKGFIVNWPLGRQLELGDLIRLPATRGRSFELKGRLAEYGVSIVSEPDPTSDDELWTSTYKVDVQTEVAAEVNTSVAKIGAGLELGFGKRGSYVFQPRRVTYDRVFNLAEVRRAIRERVPRDEWSPRLAVVTEVVLAESYALLLSESRDATVRIFAEGKPSLSISELAEPKLRGSLKVERSEKQVTTLIGASGGVVGFRAHRIKWLELETKTEEGPESFGDDDALSFDLVPLAEDDLEALLWSDEDDERDEDA